MKQFNRFFIFIVLLSAFTSQLSARKQWTEKQAWQWQNRVGVIKGFNEPYAIPGVSVDDMLKKAHEIGLNNVRLWLWGRTAEDRIAFLRNIAEKADANGLTVSPVLCVPIPKAYWESKGTDTQALQQMKEYTQKLIGAFASDRRIVMWDLWNEPGCGVNFMPTPEENFIQVYDAIAKIAEWAYEMNPTQALSSSIFWPGDLQHHRTKLHKRAWEVEALMDIHNFHDYACNEQTHVQQIVDSLRKIGDRPIVATECLKRVNNSTLARSFAIFAKNKINFHLWGLYLCERNWSIPWNHSAYDPYDPVFHNLFRPDGEPIDYRDIELIRNYKFTPGVSNDPGAEFTDRWEKQRAWRWMALGPIKGKVLESVQAAITQLSTGSVLMKYWRNNTWNKAHGAGSQYNSYNVRFHYADYKADSKQFFILTDSLIRLARVKKLTVMPTLLSDDDMTLGTDEELSNYVSHVLRHYGENPSIMAWDLYYHPGEKFSDTQRLNSFIKFLFRQARLTAYPNQPIMATPMVKAKDFKPDFDYRDALLHGRRNGWNQLAFEGASTADLCFLIWKMSDVIAFSSDQSASQTGWVKAIAYRYNRPIFCTQWQPLDEANAKETLQNFSRSHVYWYQRGETPVLTELSKFRFQPVTTHR